MKRSVLVVFAAAATAAACGGSAAPPQAPKPAVVAGDGSAATAPTPTPAAPTPTPVALTPKLACSREAALAAERCANFADIHAQNTDCEKTYAAVIADPHGKDIAACIALGKTCDDVVSCIGDANAKMAQNPTGTCADHGMDEPAVVTAAEWAARPGGASTKLADVVATKDKPVETCGMDAEAKWIGAATCADGSTPGAGIAEQLRHGNVGPGGRCNSIIDLYKIPCKEKTYDVYVDAYICPPGGT